MGLAQGQVAALRRQRIFKFRLQALDERYEARLKTAAPEAIDRYLQRVLVADSLAVVFESRSRAACVSRPWAAVSGRPRRWSRCTGSRREPATSDGARPGARSRSRACATTGRRRPLAFAPAMRSSRSAVARGPAGQGGCGLDPEPADQRRVSVTVWRGGEIPWSPGTRRRRRDRRAYSVRHRGAMGTRDAFRRQHAGQPH